MKKRVFAALMAGVMGTMMFGTTFVSAEAETPELIRMLRFFTMRTVQELCRLRLRKAPAAIFSSQQLRNRWMHWLTRDLLTRIL